MNRRETIIRAILQSHYERAFESFPTGINIDTEGLRKEVMTYLPYAEKEADAIMAALFEKEAATQSRRYFTPYEWATVPGQLKDRWWKDTDYGKLVPSAELLQAVQAAIGPGAAHAS